MLKITGTRGSWIATVKGIGVLPVVHDTFVDWKNKSHEEGPNNKRSGEQQIYVSSERWAKHAALVAEKKMVIVQRDLIVGGKAMATRDGYVGVFFVDNVKFENGSLTFDLIDRHKDG
jgi:hypothetical protein